MKRVRENDVQNGLNHLRNGKLYALHLIRWFDFWITQLLLKILTAWLNIESIRKAF